MKSINKKNSIKLLLLFLVFLFFFGFTSFVFAQDNGNSRIRELETAYPDFGFETITAPRLVTTPLHEYVLYIYYFIIIASGLFGFFSLIYAGFVYMVSTGNPHLLEDAKDQIMAALFGILILLGAVLLLRTLSGQFIVMDETFMLPGRPEIAPGVWLCTENQDDNFYDIFSLSINYQIALERFREVPTDERREHFRNQLEEYSTEGRMILREILNSCYIAQTAQNIVFEQGATHSYLVPNISWDTRQIITYGAIYFENLNQTGNIFLEFGGIYLTPVSFGAAMTRTRSILPFTYDFRSTPDSEWEVFLYQEVNKNEGFDPTRVNITSNLNCGSYLCPGSSAGLITGNLGTFSPKSLFMTSTSEFILILSTGAGGQNFTEQSHVFTRTVDNLLDFERISEEIVDVRLDYKAYRVPTATHYFLINAITY